MYKWGADTVEIQDIGGFVTLKIKVCAFVYCNSLRDYYELTLMAGQGGDAVLLK